MQSGNIFGTFSSHCVLSGEASLLNIYQIIIKSKENLGVLQKIIPNFQIKQCCRNSEPVSCSGRCDIKMPSRGTPQDGDKLNCYKIRYRSIRWYSSGSSGSKKVWIRFGSGIRWCSANSLRSLARYSLGVTLKFS